MFSKQESKREMEEMVKSSTIIGKGTFMEGNVETLGNISVDGRVNGNIKSKSKVNIGESAVVEGNIISQNAEIAGHIKGSIEVSELLVLKASAVVDGDIITNKLTVEPGSMFNGGCKMGAVVKEIKMDEVLKNGEQRSKERSA